MTSDSRRLARGTFLAGMLALAAAPAFATRAAAPAVARILADELEHGPEWIPGQLATFAATAQIYGNPSQNCLQGDATGDNTADAIISAGELNG